MARSRQNGPVVAGVAVVAISMIVAVELLRRRQRHREEVEAASWLTRAGLHRFASGEAGVFQLNDLNRAQTGMIGGAGVLRCTDTGENVLVSTMVDVPGLVLYAVEIVDGEALLLFMQVPSVEELMAFPFLDRAVRAFTKIGSKVYVARVDAVERLAGFEPLTQLSPAEQSRFSIVWNTGRCGSTLMHRMLQKVGVLSFTEPYWLDNICNLKDKGFDDQAVGMIFGVCGAIDALLARRSLPSPPSVFGAATTAGAAHVSFNPKAMGVKAMQAIMKAMPHARHMIMYRDVRKVVASFCSIMGKPPGGLAKLLRILPWARRQGGVAGSNSRPRQAAPIFSQEVYKANASGALVWPSKLMVRRITILWMETMCLWRELLEAGMIEENNTLALRMEDYTRKDPEMIKVILRFVLGERVDISGDMVTVALEAFDKHSQEGDRMAQSSSADKRRFLTPADNQEIEAVAAALPSIGSCEFGFSNSLRPGTC